GGEARHLEPVLAAVDGAGDVYGEQERHVAGGSWCRPQKLQAEAGRQYQCPACHGPMMAAMPALGKGRAPAPWQARRSGRAEPLPRQEEQEGIAWQQPGLLEEGDE